MTKDTLPIIDLTALDILNQVEAYSATLRRGMYNTSHGHPTTPATIRVSPELSSFVAIIRESQRSECKLEFGVFDRFNGSMELAC